MTSDGARRDQEALATMRKLRRASDDVAMGMLRAALTVLVLAHHSVIAYAPFAPAPSGSLLTEPRWWGGFPVVDSQRWAGFLLFAMFNDFFFMALLFFISGLFVWSSLSRKGSRSFLRDRAVRLGLPFLFAAAVIAPLAYYPSYLQRTAEPSLADFWRQWLSLGNWPAGPAWFLWMLLVFDVVAAVLFSVTATHGGLNLEGARRRPGVFFGVLIALSALAYIPLSIAFGSVTWTELGPFSFQTSRVFFYAVYFLAGVAVGAHGSQRGLLAPDGRLAERWPLWVMASYGAFGVTAYVVFIILAMPEGTVSRGWEIAGGLGFVTSCAASSFAFLALFVRFARRGGRALDSLRDNAYGMYVVHYAFVTWLQLSLLAAPLPAQVKAVAVIASTVALSWGTTAALRRLPAVARVI
jgi:hypothetical protein